MRSRTEIARHDSSILSKASALEAPDNVALVYFGRDGLQYEPEPSTSAGCGPEASNRLLHEAQKRNTVLAHPWPG
jgi:hypothetical protein